MKKHISLVWITLFLVSIIAISPILVAAAASPEKISDEKISKGTNLEATPAPPNLELLDIEEVNPYFTIEHLALPDGTAVDRHIINGPPNPPPEYEKERLASIQNLPSRGVLPTFPSYDWVFGCSAVSGAMIAGYYDRNEYTDMYTGPTNGGIMPISDTSWDTWSDGYSTYPNNPLIASHNGVDGRTTRGSIDDYWVSYGSGANDPYITGGWPQHAWGTAIGDFMKTSQSAWPYSNSDGSTSFWNYGDATKLYCSAMETLTAPGDTYKISEDDGTYGRKEFYEARGYSVTDCFNQRTDNQVTGGFSLADFQAEIDAGHPVLLNLAGHSIVGYGYSGSTIYIRDTWSSNPGYTPTMTWGGSYSGMELMSVSIVNLVSGPFAPGMFNKLSPSNGAEDVSTSVTISWEASPDAESYAFCYDTMDDDACSGWTDVETSLSKNLTGLAEGTTYYWQVRANNSEGTTYADGGDTVYWQFTTLITPPGIFDKISPLDSAVDQSTDIQLSWEGSSGADDYEYCYDTSDDDSCSSWISTGTNTYVDLYDLDDDTTYYWHVRANNGGGTTYSNDSVTAYWGFTTVDLSPGSFTKVGPSDGATGQPTNVELNWSSSSGADSYEFCYDTTDDDVCSGWTDVGSNLSTNLNGLTEDTTYYWQVRANNSEGTTYADGGDTVYWHFTTMITPPGIFDKISPLDSAVDQSTDLQLSWESSSGADDYEYCYDTSDDDSCSSWISTGINTYVDLYDLDDDTTYYWHVRANNGGGTTYSNDSVTAYWEFTTLDLSPGAFAKSSPSDGAVGQPTNVELNWSSSSGATSYEYCYDTSDDDSCTTWIDIGTLTSVSLTGLESATIYYWQIRASNDYGTAYADDDLPAFWHFTTAGDPPGTFNKTYPLDGAVDQPTDMTLSWGSSSGATGYEYCYDDSDDGTCIGWTDVGDSTSADLTDLAEGTIYYWHIRASNDYGTTYADGGSSAYWQFTTLITPPGSFDKDSPTDGAVDQTTNIRLSWESSSGADDYEYCYDTSDDDSCNSWISTGTSTSVDLYDLDDDTTYYWHVRANNGGGTTYSNGSTTAFWQFTTIDLSPGAFNKVDPSDGEPGQPTNVQLIWSSSSGATSYEFCYDTLDDDACSGWTDVGTSLSTNLTSLAEGTTYYWQVRANNSEGMTYANGSAIDYWHFTTTITPPGSFDKVSPSDSAVDQTTNIQLSWDPSSGADDYEYCYDTSDDDSCSSWISTGTNSFVDLYDLDDNTTYYWHVRANNGGGTTYSNSSITDFWQFTTVDLSPDSFTKIGPSDGAVGQPKNVQLIWASSSGATSYEYCYDKSNDDNCTSWMDNGTSTAVTLTGLDPETTYYWHIRASNDYGTTYANGDLTAYWHFTTAGDPPGSFNKTSPMDGAVDQPTDLTLSWGGSSGVISYDVCYDITDDDKCNNWIYVGASLSTNLTGLTEGTTYYWHVRANNIEGTTYADGSATAYWHFKTIITPPGSFDKTSPLDGAGDQLTNNQLSWDPSSGADGYEYCYDTSNDDSCSSWNSTGTITSVDLYDLDDNTTYYWHVRANNGGGTTYSNDSTAAFWQFTTVDLSPGSFTKVGPSDGAVGQPKNVQLIWSSSSGATSYEYCYDKSNDDSCSIWMDNSTLTSINLTGLDPATTYYWQVRANNDYGTTFADDAPIEFWQFTTAGDPPGGFNKTRPLDGDVDKPTDLTLSWGSSSGVTGYEYCYDITDDDDCDDWVDVGDSTSADLYELNAGATYFWQVRAVNGVGTTFADGGATNLWSFLTGEFELFLPLIRND